MTSLSPFDITRGNNLIIPTFEYEYYFPPRSNVETEQDRYIAGRFFVLSSRLLYPLGARAQRVDKSIGINILSSPNGEIITCPC